MTGLTSTSLRKYSVEQVVSTAAAAGAECIEWGTDYHIKTVEDALRAKKLCEEAGIKISACGSYYRIGSEKLAEWEKLCEIAEAMGTGVIRTWLGTKGSAATSEACFAALVEETEVLAKTAAGHGIIISNECHPHTFNDTTESSLRYLNAVKAPNVRTYYQSWYRDEAGDLEKLQALFPYLTDVHVSFSELEKFQRFHKKDKDFIKKILCRLKELGFGGSLLIEFTRGGKAENLTEDIRRLDALWKAI